LAPDPFPNFDVAGAGLSVLAIAAIL